MLPALRFTVAGKPVGQNDAWRISVRKPRGKKAHASLRLTEEAAAYKTQIAAAAACAAPRGWPRGLPVSVELRIYFANERPDTDGPVKLALDALQGVRLGKRAGAGRVVGGCIVNDRQVRRYSVERFVDRAHPRTEITVACLEEAA